MNTKLIHLLVVSVAMLGVLGAVAGTAQARITPVATAISATDARSEFRSGGVTVRCPRADITGTIAADGRSISGRIRFDRTATVTCTESLFGSSVRYTCTGSLTLREVSSSVATQSATYDLALDRGFNCTVSSIAPRRDINGPQTARSCTVLTARNTRLTLTCILDDSTGRGALTFSASFDLDRDLTIS